MKKRVPGFKGFRRKHWFVGGAARDAWLADKSDPTPWEPLTRTWREGEPVKVYNHNQMHQP